VCEIWYAGLVILDERDRVKRRDFIELVGGAAVWPLAARAQQPVGKVPRIGFLQGVQNENAAAFIQGLQDAGYIDGQNARIETRFFGTAFDRLGEFANELVGLQCDVIVAAAPYAIGAAMTATRTIPIVGIDLESDPVAAGWAASFSHPGGNLTGLFLDIPELGGKQIELLKEAVPILARLAVLWDSTVGAVQFRATEAAGRTTGINLQSLPIQKSGDIRDAFDRAVRERVDGLVILSSPLILGERTLIADLALMTRLPTISLFTFFPKSGGLIAYGPNLPDMYKRAATVVDRIFKGAKVGEMPIERPSRFDLVINLKTAKTLGLTIPPALLVRANEVIE
jgi:putative ABC transport system substrate-binding protein